MKPANIIDAKVSGNLSGETVKMEIDATATAHLMSVLTDLYSDRIMAFIREYATNAHDAHIEAGVSRPIEITLPNRLSSYYRVKDYGIGLDLEGIRNIYSKYGASTKRASNDFNGMLGLGCKSAMTYAAQFSIVSVKDGVEYNVAISRGADGVGEMEVMDPIKTDKINGVEIVIPVKTNDIWAVKEKVGQFFRWWPEGSVLIDGQPHKRFEGREVAKGLYTVDGLESDLIVMGNVAYPLPDGQKFFAHTEDAWGRSHATFAVVAFAPMGSVTFAPSRESLQTNKHTMNTIADFRKQFEKFFAKSIQDEVAKNASYSSALVNAYELRQKYRGIDLSGLTYKGEVVPSGTFDCPSREEEFTNIYGQKQKKKIMEYFHAYHAGGGSGVSERDSFSVEELARPNSQRLIVLNAPKTITETHKKKMREAYRAGEIKRSNLFLTHLDEQPGGKWTKGAVETIDWSVIRDFKTTSTSTSDPTIHTVHEKDGSVKNRTIPDNEKIVYVGPREFHADSWRNVPSFSSYEKIVHDAGYSYVNLGANRHAKFKREHKNALTLSEFMAQYVIKYVAQRSKVHTDMLAITATEASLLARIKGLDILDKDVLGYVDEYDSTARQEADNEMRRVTWLCQGFATPPSHPKELNIFKKYPLVGHIGSSANKQDVVDYINALYTTNEGE